MSLTAIKYQRGSLALLDQRLLPFETIYLDVPDCKTAWTHIRDMVVRGAPAIGVTGALSLAIELTNQKEGGSKFSSVQEAADFVFTTLDYLVTSRPTAVNLADAAGKLKAQTTAAAAVANATPVSVTTTIIEACEQMLVDDIAANKAMGAFGAEALLSAATARSRGVNGKLRVLTHCNTGSLATAGFGTALGVIRALHEQGKLEHAFCTETRPYNQGARLTAFELVHDGLPATLICDSAAASLMHEGRVDAVVVGADRVVANGDTANKIGTYMLSIACKHHNIPFFIAAPTTTIDPNLPDGSHIEIEQRTETEITHFKGQRVAVEGIKVWNPAFDVAPGSLIEGIITEKGMVPKDGPEFQIRPFMKSIGLWTGADANTSTPAGFRALNNDTVKDYLLQFPEISARVGAPETTNSWTVKEVGDGNINFVYIVEGPAGGVCVKQALPYVRCVGESWPLSQDRMRIEAEVLMEEARVCPAHTPQVFKYDAAMAVTVMQYLAPPCAILRRGLIAGETYPLLAQHVAEFLAQTLFHTSLLKLDTKVFREKVTHYTNTEMCRLTEQVIFTEPYMTAPNNHWTSPQLDADVAAIQADPACKAAITSLKRKFICSPEALLHGDLHTGSIMATKDVTYVIDPEFGFYGPMAFDVGKIIANLLLCYFSTDGTNAPAREGQRQWLLSCVADIWTKFSARFAELWSSEGLVGDLCPAALMSGQAEALVATQAVFMKTLFTDALQFAGSFMIRRIVGIAHVADLESIEDADVRAACERRALTLGKQLLVSPESIANIADLCAAAQACRSA